MIKVRPLLLAMLGSALLLAAPHQHAVAEEAKREVLVITVEGTINPTASEFIEKNIKRANEGGYEAMVIEMDTPGGLDTSMRSIIKAMINSDVPVVVFVAPPGSRAASAGAFITIAAHVAAMAPQTNIGAAHPVGVGTGMDKTTAEKATNDAAAYIKSLAERRGRNAQWAEDAVRKSISSSAEDALQKNVIDFMAKDVNSLLEAMDGMKVQTVGGDRVLKTRGATVERERMGFRHRVLDFISDPNVAYILMILGFYGLFFEMTNPGAVFPGVVGAISLILAFYAFQTLSVNYAGLLLILLALILFALEVKVTSYGVLAIGGIISMIMGSLMLFEKAGPFFKLSLYVLIPAALVTAAFFTTTVGLAMKARRRKPITGVEGLVGEEGTALTDITPEGGMAALHGEIWRAFSDGHIDKGKKVVVMSVTGLKVKVRKKEEG